MDTLARSFFLPPQRHMEVTVSDPTRLDRLTTARDRLSDLIDTADERTAPALVREYRAVLTEIDAADGAKEAGGLDDIARRRAARTATA